MVGSFVVSMSLLVANRWLAEHGSPGAWCEALKNAGILDVEKGVFSIPAHVVLLITVFVTTLVWLAVTLLTRPTSRERLIEFYRLTRPAGPGWKLVRGWGNLPPSSDSLSMALACWVLGCAAVYSALFGAGSLIFGATAQGVTLLGVFVVCSAGLCGLVVRAWGSQGSRLSAPQ
jgi:hypothetical protein